MDGRDNRPAMTFLRVFSFSVDKHTNSVYKALCDFEDGTTHEQISLSGRLRPGRQGTHGSRRARREIRAAGRVRRGLPNKRSTQRSAKRLDAAVATGVP